MRSELFVCLFALRFLDASSWELPENSPFVIIDPTADELVIANTPLGEGSWGEVYKAVSKDSGELVVLKVPRGGMSIGDRVPSLAKGCEFLRSLGIGPADHLMSCLEYVHAPPEGFAVFDFCGRNGFAVVSTVGPHVVHQLAKQLFLSLTFLAQASPPLVHMDVKWDNTAVDSQMCLKLIDVDDLWNGTLGHSQTGAKVYTPKFAPRDVEIDGPADLSFFCGAPPLSNSDSSCPHAFAFDVYSAGGSMMSFMCGLVEAELVARCVHHGAMRAKCLQSLFRGRFREDLTSLEQEGVLFMNVINAYPLEPFPLFSDTGAVQKYFVDDPKRRMAGAVLKNESLANSFSAEVKQFGQKQKHCIKLFADPGTSSAILGAVTAKPEQRWSPSRLLESPLFQDLSTGCPLDGNASESQAYLDQHRVAAQTRLTRLVELGIAKPASGGGGNKTESGGSKPSSGGSKPFHAGITVSFWVVGVIIALVCFAWCLGVSFAGCKLFTEPRRNAIELKEIHSDLSADTIS